MASPPQFKISPRLNRSFDGKPGILRERTRNGFRYRNANGRLVRDLATLQRVRAIVIPPAWEKVWICPTATGHIQATGRDAKGRKQYRYHPAFRENRETDKFSHLAEFGKVLPRIRMQVRMDLAYRGLPREKILALIVALLDRTHLRLGNSEYVKANHSYGLSTLLTRHVRFVGRTLRMRFRGKSGKWHERLVTDNSLVQIVRSCHGLPGAALFQYRAANGEPHRIGSLDVNAYISKSAGGYFTAKNFRTWAGSVIALAKLVELPTPSSKTEARKCLVKVFDEVAEELGNTRSVCRKSYVHPSIPKAFQEGVLPHCRKRAWLSATENCLLRLLQREKVGNSTTGSQGTAVA